MKRIKGAAVSVGSMFGYGKKFMNQWLYAIRNRKTIPKINIKVNDINNLLLRGNYN